MMDLITLDLVLAFREAGCPLCRLRSDSVRRYLFHLLYENVTDGPTRLHLARAQGFCPDHAWQLQAFEHIHWQDGLGVGIIYEDLTGMVLGTLREYLARTSRPLRRARTSLRGRTFGRDRSGRLGRWLAGRALAPAQWLLTRLAPAQRCPVCETADQSEEGHLAWLVRGITDTEFRKQYVASDGLCLPHLRRALACAEDEEAARWLAQVAVDKLAPLAADLAQYTRKHAWQNRDEPKHPWEQAAWIRAVAFFAGESDDAGDESPGQARERALADYRTRPEVVAESTGNGRQCR